MVTVTFAAKVLDGRQERRPERVRYARNLVTPVVNPFTNRVLWVPTLSILNIVDGVAAIRMHANYSGRLRWRHPGGYRELLNGATGNTFLVHHSAIHLEYYS